MAKTALSGPSCCGLPQPLLYVHSLRISPYVLTVAVALQVRLECYRVSLVPVKEAAEELMKKLKAALGASLRRKVRSRPLCAVLLLQGPTDYGKCTEHQQP